MDTILFSRFAPLLRSLDAATLDAEIKRPERLLLASGNSGSRKLEIAYAPFEYINPDARIVIVGLTPGRQQMTNSLHEARRALLQSKSEADALAAAKVFASFSGPMRSNLVSMLDSIGVHEVLNIKSTASLWGSDQHLVHFTSALRNPVFVDGQNYSGNPSILTTSMLRDQLMAGFAQEATVLRNALFVPLGPKVAEAVEDVARQVGIDRSRVLAGLPHPSGANAERISFFLGRKHRDQLSAKVEPDRIIRARRDLEQRIAALRPDPIKVA